METSQQRKIRELLEAEEGNEQSSDTSLRAHALEHTAEGYVPKTLTPYEWEQWYAEHGVPPSHRKHAHGAKPAQSFWRRILRFVHR